MSSSHLFKMVLVAVAFACIIESAYCIRCYRCRGDDECDFTKRMIYVENCTWATKCWGARIGGHYIRGCADDRCDIQLGLGSYIESKCCYKDLCNDDVFFMPDSSFRFQSFNKPTLFLITILTYFLTAKLFNFN